MATFSYTAVDKNGREIRSSLESENRERAFEELKKSGLLPISLTEAGALSREVRLGFLESKPKARDLSLFCRQFVSIINAGVSVISALELLIGQTENKRLRAAISDCKLSIEKGESLASAMGEHRELFSDVFITMVEAGESSGSLDIAFSRMAVQFEKDARLRATVKKASIYPVIVTLVAIGVVIGMLAFVIPTFQSMFDQLGTELPALTKAVIAASRFIQDYWYFLLAGVVLLVFFFRGLRTNEGYRRARDRMILKLGPLGRLSVKSASARMARTLSTLLAAGIPLIDALEITAGTLSNVVFKEALLDAKDDVSMGSVLSEPLKRGRRVPGPRLPDAEDRGGLRQHRGDAGQAGGLLRGRGRTGHGAAHRDAGASHHRSPRRHHRHPRPRHPLAHGQDVLRAGFFVKRLLLEEKPPPKRLMSCLRQRRRKPKKHTSSVAADAAPTFPSGGRLPVSTRLYGNPPDALGERKGF